MSDTTATNLSQNDKFIGYAFRSALLPCMLAMLSVNINVLVDGILVSNMIGENALAAINLSLPLYLFLCVVGSFFGYGSSTPASLAMGSNNKAEYTTYYRTGTTLLIIASVIITVLGLVFINPIDAILCNDDAILPYVHEYVFITLAGALPKLMIYIPFGYLRLDGRNAEVMIMMLSMAVINIVLDIYFIYFLGMGVFGAGLASVIATALVCVVGFIWLFDKKSSFKYKPFISKDPTVIKRILRSGAPFGLNNLLSTLRALMINSILLSAGGAPVVAILTAINGVSGFAESFTLGVPQAGNVIMGICQGEGDTPSMKILFSRMIKTGFICLAAFSIVVMAASPFIAGIYKLDTDLTFPLFMMVLGLFPCLFFNALQNYYNITQKEMWANSLIFIRLIAMTWLSLIMCINLDLSPWPFLVLSELFSLILWVAGIFIKKARTPNESTVLFIKQNRETSKRYINFSVRDTSEDICSASERISDFCSENGMTLKETMRLSMSIEEILQMVLEENPGKRLSFDLRAFCLLDIIGIRFRYAGKNYNPFIIPEEDPDNKYLGVKMIENMVEVVHHYRTFGTNTVLVLLADRTAQTMEEE